MQTYSDLIGVNAGAASSPPCANAGRANNSKASVRKSFLISFPIHFVNLGDDVIIIAFGLQRKLDSITGLDIRQIDAFLN